MILSLKMHHGSEGSVLKCIWISFRCKNEYVLRKRSIKRECAHGCVKVWDSLWERSYCSLLENNCPRCFQEGSFLESSSTQLTLRASARLEEVSDLRGKLIGQNRSSLKPSLLTLNVTLMFMATSLKWKINQYYHVGCKSTDYHLIYYNALITERRENVFFIFFIILV